MPERVTLGELVQAALHARLTDLHVAMPARVQAYNAAKQTVDALPQFDRAIADDDGSVVLEHLPVIPSVPVAFPRAGGFFVSLPIAVGDFVLLVFCERDLNTWRQRGAQGDPADLEMHGLSGAVAIPGVYPSSQALAGADGSNMVMGKDGGAQIQITPGGEVRLGAGNASEAVVKGNAYRNAQAKFNQTGTQSLTTVAAALTAAAADPVFAALCSTAASQFAKAGADLLAAVTAFEALSTQFLSQVVKTA